MNYTSIEQSKKLLKLGLSSESADMEYKCVGFTMHTNRPTDEFKYKLMPKEVDIPHKAKYDIPCWSVGALLDIIPMVERGSMELYKDWEYKCTLQNDYYCTPRFNTLIEAAYNMVVWLLENNYIKND